MYIAFKWLLSLTFAMWLFACSLDVYFISIKETSSGVNIKDVTKVYNNLSVRSKQLDMDTKINKQKTKKTWFGIYHYYAIFCAAGFIITAVNKRNKLILLDSLRRAYFETYLVRTFINYDYLKRTANDTYCVLSKHLLQVRNDVERVIQNWQGFKYFNTKPTTDEDATKQDLLKKLKELREEKKNLSLLLAAAICENRNIVVGYRLDATTKNKLVVQTKENRRRKEYQSNYLNFQQLYSVTYRENLYLHSQIKQLTRMKEIAEKNLLNLVHKIWLSKNEKLMAYCSRFVVQSKDKILSADMRAEIEKFLQSSRLDENERVAPAAATTTLDNKCKSLELRSHLCPSSSAPTLVGLPGEHIWTVKDRDGFIEKLYEYDFQTNGNTIRRIREYSVYHDKDCFFENFSSRTIIHDDSYGGAGECKANLNCNRIQNQRFLTGSQAFQMFLQNTQNFIIPVKTFYGPSISYG